MKFVVGRFGVLGPRATASTLDIETASLFAMRYVLTNGAVLYCFTTLEMASAEISPIGR
jgi:hypothetical protein